ncbi:MAG: hypothetical protein M3R62_12135 [Acidobacteriota bacterium]|nr:hypothetical protein [Acidobacteriota bacterium]
MIQVSTSGGVRPRWRGDGGELFFVAGGTVQSVLAAVPVEENPNLPATMVLNWNSELQK